MRFLNISQKIISENLRSRLILFFWALFLFTPRLLAQEQQAPYLLPQTIFVGDPGRLVVPLGRAFAEVAPFVLDTSGDLQNPDPLVQKLPAIQDMVIRRVELEHRGGVTRLVIDFIPYAPGKLSFPPIELPVPDAAASPADFTISGLEVQVASILSPQTMSLSEPAPPLAVPGTSLLVYGTLVLVLVLLFLGIGGSLWGRRHFADIWERFRRRHLLRVMMRFLRRLRQEGVLEKNRNAGYYLTLLSGEFREFLSFFTGFNCRSLTAGEFLELPLGTQFHPDTNFAADMRPQVDTSAGQGGGSPLSDSTFLCRLFRTWDTLRFSGHGMGKDDLFQALNETEKFIVALDRAERERVFSKHAPASEAPHGQKAGLVSKPAGESCSPQESCFPKESL